MRACGGSVMLWGLLGCHGSDLLVLLQVRDHYNNYKVVLNDHLYAFVKHVDPNGSSLLQVTMPQSIGYKRSLNGLMEMT